MVDVQGHTHCPVIVPRCRLDEELTEGGLFEDAAIGHTIQGYAACQTQGVHLGLIVKVAGGGQQCSSRSFCRLAAMSMCRFSRGDSGHTCRAEALVEPAVQHVQAVLIGEPAHVQGHSCHSRA